jgi:hypothetical protein
VKKIRTKIREIGANRIIRTVSEIHREFLAFHRDTGMGSLILRDGGITVNLSFGDEW